MQSSLSVSQGTSGGRSSQTKASPPPRDKKSSSSRETHESKSNPVTTDATAASSTNTRPAEEESLDFIGSSHAVKDLFSLPYEIDRPISVALHNLDGTLLIDADHGSHLVDDDKKDDVETKTNKLPTFSSTISQKTLTEASAEDNHGEISNALVALSSLELDSEALTIVNSVIRHGREASGAPVLKDKTLDNKNTSSIATTDLPPPDEYVHSYLPPVPEPREYLTWKFQNMSLLVGSSAMIYRTSETALTVRVEEANDLKALLRRHEERKGSGQFLPDDEQHHRYHHRNAVNSKLSYADATRRSLPVSETTVASTTTTPNQDTTNQAESFSAPDLAHVRLQTCIVAAPNSPVGGLLSGRASSREESSSLSTAANTSATLATESRSPVSTVLDIYLDNIMANVPQLALCLQEKGFVQSVKLLQTEEIPSGLLNARTLDTTTPFDVIHNSQADKVFSPKIMETNASTLLRFLKTNCSRNNSTYLLRREAGQTNIQLYDITTISTQRQRQWVWWLAMMSYRFANRLRHVAASVMDDSVLRRNCRARQRSLLQNTLDLLEVLADMDGNKHESLVSAVCENLADTFLVLENDENQHDVADSNSSKQTPPLPATSVALAKQPYASLSVDALNKAQDHLKQAIKGLEPVLHEQVDESGSSPRIAPGSESSQSGSDQDVEAASEQPSNSSLLRRVEPVVTQLFGLYHKFVNVSLRLAEIHLRNYYSSSAMQALRLSARTIAASLFLVQLVQDGEEKRVEDWLSRIQLQYTWLWEHCGHFARSFAADELWRDRGHASGDDIISVLQDAERAFVNFKGLNIENPLLVSRFIQPDNPLSTKSHGLVNLQSLSGVVRFVAPLGKAKVTSSSTRNDIPTSLLDVARSVLDEQRVILREKRRVLVAASVAYYRAIQSFREGTLRTLEPVDDVILTDSALIRLLQQRLGDACNETGKILLNEVRVFLTSTQSGPGGSVLERDEMNGVAEVLLSSAQFWFFESLAAFEDCHDLRNLALLRCNLCQSYKFRANHMFSPAKATAPSDSHAQGPTHAELCLQEAANHLQAAHESLGERHVDPVTWDMVSEELAATFLVLGVRRRQTLIGSSNNHLLIMQALRLSPGREHSIVDPMERALTIYQQLGNRHQAAACHYQLALYFSKVWPCQANEAKTREKLASAFTHYNAALAYFGASVRGNEVTYALLCLDLSNLYSIVSGFDSTNQALKVCLDSVDAFSSAAIESAASVTSRDDWFRQMDTLATSMEETVFKLLRALVKLEEEKNRSRTITGTSSSSVFKGLYRTGLQAKMTATIGAPTLSTGSESTDKIAVHLLSVHKILSTLRAASKTSTPSLPS